MNDLRLQIISSLGASIALTYMQEPATIKRSGVVPITCGEQFGFASDTEKEKAKTTGRHKKKC